jgi:hypothetical protein
MQIIESALFTTLIPDKGYKIVNKNNGKFYKKVILSPNDSIDNYGEVVDEKYINMDYVVEMDELKASLEETIKQNELTINLLLFSIDELYMSVEPLLAMVPMTLDEDYDVNISKLAYLYALMIKRDLKKINEIPERFREEVKKIL